MYMERNSRDFISRNERTNRNAEAVATLLLESNCCEWNIPFIIARADKFLVKDVYYPKLGEQRPLYDRYRTPHGGYGGLFSVTFRSTDEAIVFFDALNTAKGPSLGTSFTLR